MANAFETQSPLTLNGTIQPSLIQDPDINPTTILKSTDPFKILVNWNVNGNALTVMGGNFNINAFFENLGVDAGGGPQDAQFGPVVVNVTSGVGPGNNKNYQAQINVPAGALKAGAYDMVCLLTYTNLFGLPGNIAAYTDEIVVQIYNPNPLLP